MFDTFIKIAGIDGESLDSKHANWIDVVSFSHSMQQPASATTSAAGGAAGRVHVDDFHFVKGLDKASPKLYEACCKGTHLATVTVEMCRASDTKLCYMKIDMVSVIVSAVSPSGNPKGADTFPSEAVSLSPSKYTWTYTQQDRATGASKGQVQTIWDVAQNKAG